MDFKMVFLFILVLVFVIFAVAQDLRKREIANWLNFSLIVFALSFRFFYSLFSTNLNFLYQGLLGLAIFFILGNLLYYSRFFAGGDAKLLISLGTILPLSLNFNENLQIFLVFFILLFIFEAFYTIAACFYLSLKNFKKFKKEFSKQLKLNKKVIYLGIFLAIVMGILSLVINGTLIIPGILLFILPYLYVYTKSVDESCMVKKINPQNLTEGDWLYKDVKLGKKTIEAKWDGLTKYEIVQFRKNRKPVLIRYGIPFSPVFLVTILIIFYLIFNGNLIILWNSLW